MQKHRAGFTLIECLVALFIVTIVLASASRAIGLIISDVHDTFVREVATWVAENEYNMYFVNNEYPDIGAVKKKVSLASIDFDVSKTVKNTPNPYFRQIDIAISEQKTPDYVIFKTVVYVSQY